MKLIAFTGKKQTGKSTACTYLEEKYGFTRTNFKDALIVELKKNFPDLLKTIFEDEYEKLLGYCNHDKIKSVDDLFEHKPPLVRTLMQNYGTNVRRKDKDSYWVDKWTDALWSKEADAKTTVDDVRFLNEASRVRGQGGVIIRLVRTDMTHTDSHVSETEMDCIVPDYTITCKGGDQEHLYRELDAILTK